MLASTYGFDFLDDGLKIHFSSALDFPGGGILHFAPALDFPVGGLKMHFSTLDFPGGEILSVCVGVGFSGW